MRGWAVLVGINHYTDPTIRPLRYCVNDAQELYELLVVSPATGYQRERMRLLTSAAKEHITANRRDIFTNLAEVAAQVTNQELLLFYYAGHGQVMDNEVYLLPTDVENHLAMSDLAVSLRRIKEIIQKSKARTKIVILDACYCGVPLERGLTQRGLAQQKREFIHRLTQEAQGFAILAPSARDEPALEWEEKRHGVFSYFLLEGLREAVDTQGTGFVTLKALEGYVSGEVEAWAVQHGIVLRPTLEFAGNGDPVIFIRSGSAETNRKSSAVTPSASDPVRDRLLSSTLLSPITGSKDFYGRSGDLERVRNVLTETTKLAIIIQGERRIGKTSMLNRIKALLDEEQWENRDLLYFSIEPGGITSCADFAKELWNGLLGCTSASSSIVNLPFSFDAATGFAFQLRRMLSDQISTTVVVFVDRFSKLLSNCEPLEQQRIIGLIRHIVEGIDLPLIFILSTIQDLPQEYGSLFPADNVTLRPFDRADTDKLVTELLGEYTGVTSDALEWIFDHSGGHPYLIKLLLARLRKLDLLKREQPVSTQMLELASQAIVQDKSFRVWLDDIYKNYLTDDHKDLLLWLTNLNQGIPVTDIRVFHNFQFGELAP